MNESDIFETNSCDTKDENTSSNSNNEDVVEEIKTKTKKQRKPLTEERKAILRANLKAGREKSIETRKRNKQLKALEKEEKIKEQDDKLLKALELKRNKKNNESSLLQQIADLKKKIKEQEEPKEEPKKEEPKEEPKKEEPKQEPKKEEPKQEPKKSQSQKNKNLYNIMRGIR